MRLSNLLTSLRWLSVYSPLKVTMSVIAMTGITACSSPTTQASDELFHSAQRNSANEAMLDQFYASMQNNGSVLAYYPEYWKLNNNLALQSASSIVGFAKQYPNSAMAEKLAADYIEEKVKLGDFAGAVPVLNYVTNADPAEACAIGQVRANTGDQVALIEHKDVFFATNTQPESCMGLARFMLNSALMSDQDKQLRMFATLRAGQLGLAFSSAAKVGVNLSLSQMNQIVANPLQYLWTAPKATAQDQAYLVLALGRLADSDLNSAISMVDSLAQGLPDHVQKYLYRTVAYIGGTTVLKNNFNASLPNYFDKSYGYPFTPEEAEIYARQSIRFSNWEGVIRSIDVMSSQQKEEDRWQYWLARATEQRGGNQNVSTAQQIYKKLAVTDDYHGLLAKARLKDGGHKLPANYEPTAQDMARLSQDVHFSRAFTLREIGASVPYINREWNWAVRQAYLNKDDGMILAAAKRATDIGWYDRAIYAADRTIEKQNYQLRYPTPYKELVVSHSQSAGISPAWAYGLMRQESRFNINAKSHVGAGGLMQVMPGTAQQIARELGEAYSSAALSNMNTNIRYGTYYLGMIQSQLSYSHVLATAGYNGGPNRARRWQPITQALPADQYAESIPILETRDYVKHVLSNAVHYGLVLGQGTSQSISQFMADIPAQ